jgi:hypothetical protein
MVKYYINPAILSSKKAGGISLNAIVRAVLADCGLDCTQECPDDDCLPTTNRSGNRRVASKAATKQEFRVGVALLLAKIETLEAKIAELEAKNQPKAPETTEP